MIQYTFKNHHFFGEAAVQSTTSKAFVGGLITAVSKNIDVAFLHRNISKSFYGIYANAFVENWEGRNEIGNYFSEEQLGDNLQFLPQKISELITKTPGILCLLTEKQLGENFSEKKLAH